MVVIDVLVIVRPQPDLGDQRAMVAGAAGELAVAARQPQEVHVAAHEDRVERAQRAPRREGERAAVDAAEAGWREQGAEPAVDIVEVGFDDFRNGTRMLDAFLTRPAVVRGLEIPHRP